MGMTKEEGDKLAQMAADIINAHIDRQVDRASTITTGGGA